MTAGINEKTIMDFMGMNADSPELEKMESEILKDYDISEVYEAHVRELKDLAVALEALETVKKEYDPSKHAREAIEEVYLTVMYYTYRLARRFNPLTDHGRELLARADELRKEYEASFSPLITGISAENLSSFEGLLSDDIMEDIENGRLKGLGILRTDLNTTLPVAACAYRWVELPDELEEAPMIDVKWIYVAPLYRGRSISDFIMAELVNLMIRKGASALSVGYAVNEYAQTVIQLLSEWGFQMSSTINPEFRCRLGEVGKNRIIAKEAKKATPLGELSKEEQKNVIRRYLKASDQLSVLEYLVDRPDYYDGDLSCFVGKKEAAQGILLVHKKPSEVLEVEYFDSIANSGEVVLELLASCIDSAVGKYATKNELILYTESEQLEELLDRIIPKQRVTPYIEAVLTVPEIVSAEASFLTHI